MFERISETPPRTRRIVIRSGEIGCRTEKFDDDASSISVVRREIAAKGFDTDSTIEKNLPETLVAILMRYRRSVQN